MTYRTFLIRFFTFIGGVYYFLEFLLPKEILGVEFGAYNEQISTGFIAVGAMAFGLGLINLVSIHGTKVAYRRKGWRNSIALLTGLLLMIVVAYQDWANTDRIARMADDWFFLREFSTRIVTDLEAHTPDVPPVPVRQRALLDAVAKERAELAHLLSQVRAEPAIDDERRQRLFESALDDLAQAEAALGKVLQRGSAEEGDALSAPAEFNAALAPALTQVGTTLRQALTVRYERDTWRRMYQLLFGGLYTALGSAMFSLLGFYIATAAYRAFRVRSAEAALMMLAALLVMLGQVPFGMWLWEGFPDLRFWLLTVPSAAARRAIEIGVAVAGLVMAFRMWLSIESESFSQGGKR